MKERILTGADFSTGACEDLPERNEKHIKTIDVDFTLKKMGK
jgi:hypothetical protein